MPMTGSYSTDTADEHLAAIYLFIQSASCPLHLCSLQMTVCVLLDVSVDDCKCCGSICFHDRRIFALVLATILSLQLLVRSLCALSL